MRSHVHKLTNLALMFFLAASIVVARPAADDKITVEEVIAKHLESIGSAAARSANKSRVIQGSVLATIRIGGSGKSQGGSVMASQGNMSLIGMIFGPQEYGNEKMAWDGSKITLGEFRPGERTELGAFIRNHQMLLKEGLLGGTLSTGWVLLDLTANNPKLSYGGTKKINGRQTHVLKYESRKGGALQTRLYFDAETFQHVRSEYEQSFLPPAARRPEDMARQKESHLKFTEEFSDFRKEGDLTLPHTYKMQLSFNTLNNALLQDWVLNLTQFVFNKEISQTQFDLAAK
jgi:hypothetical protein